MLRRAVEVCCLVVIVSSPVQGLAKEFVAGLQPDRRPTSSPRITAFVAEPSLKATRLKGVSSPLPGNVAEIAAQGAWYSPMFQPGMTGPYDLRQWHAR